MREAPKVDQEVRIINGKDIPGKVVSWQSNMNQVIGSSYKVTAVFASEGYARLAFCGALYDFKWLVHPYVVGDKVKIVGLRADGAERCLTPSACWVGTMSRHIGRKAEICGIGGHGDLSLKVDGLVLGTIWHPDWVEPRDEAKQEEAATPKENKGLDLLCGYEEGRAVGMGYLSGRE